MAQKEGQGMDSLLDPTEVLAVLWEAGQPWLAGGLVIAGLIIAFRATLVGWLGETGVGRRMARYAIDAVHDVILENERGQLTQIDHLLLTPAGILVVETKTYSGRLFGRARDKRWTQKSKAGSHAIKNPLHQNFGHVKAVEGVVGNSVPVENCVVVAGSATFPKGQPEGVYRPSELIRRVRSETDGASVPASWSGSWNELKRVARQDQEARQAHRRQLEERFGRDFRLPVGLALAAAGVVLGLLNL